MNLGFPEMLFIFVLALIIFGPKKMPEIGRQIGKALAEFKRASNEFKYQLDTEIRQLDADTKVAGGSGSSSAGDSVSGGIGRAVAEFQRISGEVKSRFETGLRDLDAEPMSMSSSTAAESTPIPSDPGEPVAVPAAPAVPATDPAPPSKGADA